MIKWYEHNKTTEIVSNTNKLIGTKITLETYK